MPNKVFFTDGKTPYKVIRALTQDDTMSLEEALATIDRLTGNGLEIVEPAPKNATADPVSE